MASVFGSLRVQFPGLLLDLQTLNFSNNHYIYDGVTTIPNIRFCSFKACKDIRVFKHCMSKLMPRSCNLTKSKTERAKKAKCDFHFHSVKHKSICKKNLRK